MIETMVQHHISGKTAFHLINRDYGGRKEVMRYLQTNYMPFDLEEFIEEAIRHNYRFSHIYEILRQGYPLPDPDLKLYIGKQFGFY